jgi:hypothetical protein
VSETVHYKGKLIKLDRLNHTETLEEHAKRLWGDKGLDDYYDSYVEALGDISIEGSYQSRYIIRENKIYEVKDFKNIDYDRDIFNLEKINGNDFKFEVMYYNGGCGFNEAIDYAFEGLKDGS